MKVLIVIGILVLGSAIALQTGIARLVFYEIFAFVEGVDVLGPTIVRTPPHDSPYEHWLWNARTEIPVLDGLVIDDVSTVALQPWPQMGEDINGLYLRFADYQIIDGRILELPPSAKTASQRHFYEVGIYFISGSGHTIIQQEGESPKRVDWQAGDLFSVPLNVRYQHFSDSDGPVRMLAITSFPFVVNAVDNLRFIEENPFIFSDRYDGAEDYLDQYEQIGKNLAIRNVVKNVRQTETRPLDFRGEGSRNMTWLMAGNSMIKLHVSEIPPDKYKKAHRHSSDAFILFLSGEGFSVTWPEGRYDKRYRVDWKAGTLLVPPTYWYHQHLNPGHTAARYLAINAPVLVRNLGLRFEDQLEKDLPEIREAWKREKLKEK
jgi:gentisate 1,2-dioxygenase